MPAIDRRGREIPVHRLRPNETVWTPPSVVFLDTETCWHLEGDDEVHELRLWVTCHVDRRNVKKRQGPVTWGWGETRSSLAQWLTGRAVGRECIWIYAHNLHFDLVTSNMAAEMTELGWRVTEFSVTAGAPWLRLSRGGKTITVVDSWAWLPERLQSLATLMGRRKVALPDNSGELAEWVARCSVDVELLARAVLGLMDWWSAESLGRWTISGAGSGWNAMRHTASDERHVIDVEPALVAQDRLAVRGGRKDAQVVRAAAGGPWVELDFEAAYPTIARECPLPMKRAWTFDRLPLDSKWLSSRFFGVIAEARIRTDRPRYPVKHDGVTWYPVGEFTTTLAGPELAEARRNGDLLAVGPGQAHRLGLGLRPWATWVLDPTRGGEVEVPPVALVATKAWGRSVLGKFAAKSHTSDELEGPAPDGWGITDCWDRRVGRRAAEVKMGGRAFLVTYDGDTENCYPAVLAWVQSEVNVRLGRVLERLGDSWWTCDTDGLLVDMTVPMWQLGLGAIRLGDRPRDHLGLAAAICDELAPLVAPLRLRPKREYHSLDVIGPQHLTLDGERRMSGVRGDAVETEPHRYVAHDWPRLKWQMQHSAPGVYRRPRRESTFREPTVHRWVLADGSTRPVEMVVTADGSNRILPWAETRRRDRAAELGELQYRLLRRVIS